MIRIGGHRGFGCTDHPFYQGLDITRNKPAENTVTSIIKAFQKGAHYVEYDTVQTKDDQIVVIHSNQISDHFFNQNITQKHISALTLEELKTFRTGPQENGVVPTLLEVIGSAQQQADDCDDFIVNVELKGTQATTQSRNLPGQTPFIDCIVNDIRRSSASLSSFLFSSFSLRYLIALKEALPDARTAMLFDENPPNKEPAQLFPGDESDTETYLHFTSGNIERAIQALSIEFVHPEISTVTTDVVKLCASHNVGINTWALFEEPPQDNPKAAQTLENVIHLCRENNVSLGITTDYVPQIRQYIKDRYPRLIL